jgi:hypothetical protein
MYGSSARGATLETAIAAAPTRAVIRILFNIGVPPASLLQRCYFTTPAAATLLYSDVHFPRHIRRRRRMSA